MSITDFMGNESELVDYFYQFLKGWKQDLGTVSVPPYTSFNPVKMRSLLSHISILEMDQAGGVFYRLCGSSIENYYGRYMTNTQVSDPYGDINEAEAVNEILAQAIVQGSGLIRINKKSFFASNSKSPSVMLCLPLEHHKVLGGNLLLCLNFFNDEFSTSAMAPFGEMASKMNVAENWGDLTYFDINHPFNADQISDTVKAFFKKRRVNVSSLPLTQLITYLADETEKYASEDIYHKTISYSDRRQ